MVVCNGPLGLLPSPWQFFHPSTYNKFETQTICFKLLLYWEILQPFLIDSILVSIWHLNNGCFIQFFHAFLHESIIKVHSYLQEWNIFWHHCIIGWPHWIISIPMMLSLLLTKVHVNCIYQMTSDINILSTGSWLWNILLVIVVDGPLRVDFQ